MAQFKNLVTVIVKVNPESEWGQTCLNEIRGLKEGDIIRGILNPVSKAVDFHWKNNEPACLWLNDNCELIKTRRKPLNLRLGNLYVF